ncbi:hypothetical protein BJX76DRAFT_354825 [Aspergillus varians]
MRIGCSVPQLVHQLPFAFTWSDKYLYLTVSSSQLRLYRVDLEMISKPDAHGRYSSGSCRSSPSSPHQTMKRKESYPQPSAPTSQPIFSTPTESIFLPRSARDRAVQFFPSPVNEDGPSLVVVGPRYGTRPQPGMVVYLTDQDLGEWANIEAKEGDGAQQEPAHQRVVGRFEDFDEEEDCDLIPVLER